MNRLRTLTKVILLVNFSFLRFRHQLRNERLNLDTVVLGMIVVTIGGFLMYDYVRMMGGLYLYFQQMGMESAFLAAVLGLFNALLLLLGSFFILNLFCFSRDDAGLLYLPIQPGTLLFGKLLVSIGAGYALALLLLVPPLILYGVEHFSAGYAIAAIGIVLASPIMPLTTLGGIALVALKLSAIWRKHPGWIAALGHLLLLAGFGLMTRRMLASADSGDALAAWWPQLEAGNGGCALLTYLGLSGGVLYLFWLLGSRLFPVGLTLHSHTGRRSRPAPRLNKAFAAKHPYISYFHKEWRLFFREPVYVLNGMAGVVLVPLLLPLSLRFGGARDEMDGIRSIVAEERFAFMATIVALAVVVITSGLNVVASSSVSREGRHHWLCRLVPLPYRQQIWVKAAFAVAVGGIGLLLNSLVFFYFGYRLPQILLIFAIGMLFGVAWSALGVLIDVLHPKLGWVNRSEAVKQNINVILAILLNALVIGGYYRFLTFALSNHWNEKLVLAGIAVSVLLLAAAALQGIAWACRRQEQAAAWKTTIMEEDAR